jgi:hypothetical protein
MAAALARDDDRLYLSSHRGDGAFGARGLATPGNPELPQAVHEGPIDQSWGTREF